MRTLSVEPVRPTDPPIIAAATQINFSNENPDDLSSRAKRVGEAKGWQGETWRWYGCLGTVWYSHNYVGNALSRLMWHVGVREASGDLVAAYDDDDEPSGPAANIDPQILSLASEAVRSLVGAAGSASEWARPLGVALSAVAEGYLIGVHVDMFDEPVLGEIEIGDTGEMMPNPEADRLIWESYSPTEVTRKGGEVRVQRTEGGEPTKLPKDAMIVRIWRRHPRWPDDPDGSMAAMLDICEDMQILSRSIRGSALSRTHAGVLLIPSDGLGVPLTQQGGGPLGAQVNGNGQQIHPVINEVIAGLSTPIKDSRSVSALVPTAITTKGDKIDQWKHLSLGRDIDPTTLEQLAELKRAYAQGVDLPPEVILGVADLNHWTAWQVGEDAWRHVRPHADIVRDGITVGYMWPYIVAGLEEAGRTNDEGMVPRELLDQVRQLSFAYDPSEVLIHPDRGDDAAEALRLGAISVKAYRRYKHFDEPDAPDAGELEERQALGLLGSTTNRVPVSDSNVDQSPPEMAVRARITSSRDGDLSVLVASAHNFDSYADAVADLETQFLRDVLLMADAAVDEATRKASARLRSAAQRDPVLRGVLHRQPVDQVPGLLGRRNVVALARARFQDDPVTEDAALDDLSAEVIALLLLRYGAVTTAALASWRRLTRSSLGVEFDDTFIERQEADAAASQLVLAESIRQVARNKLLGAVASPDPTGAVPAGVIDVPPAVARRAAARAGGLPVGPGVTLDDVPDVAAAGIVTGPTANEELESAGFTRDAVRWVYGSAATRQVPFEPHEDLDGKEWASYDDMLDATAADSPWGDGMHPGDHRGCQCILVPVWDGPEA